MPLHMKKIFSLLLAFVFLQSQTWALSGGPNYFSSGGFSLTGVYAGVLTPSIPATAGASASSIGLFSIAVPDTGLATGSLVVFVDGTSYVGTVTGVADPREGTLTGVIDAASTYTISTIIQTGTTATGQPIFTTIDTNIFAQGNLQAEVTQDSSGVNQFNNSSTPALGSTRLEGTAILDLFNQLDNDGSPIIDQTVTFEVDGYRQSETVTTAATIDFTGFNPQTP